MCKFVVNNNVLENQIYHYTSIGVLYSIIKNKELWLTNLSTMNDKTECIEFYEQMEKELISDCNDSKHKIQDMISEVRRINEDNYPFAMCFSELNDDAAQWERYADNACGVKITFNINNLKRLLSSLPLTVEKVQYSSFTNIKNYKYSNYNYFMSFFQPKSNFSLLCDKNEFLKKYTEALLMQQLTTAATCYKNGSFSSEKEIRMYNNEYFTEDIEKLDEINIEYECINGIIKKILKIRLNPFFSKTDLSLEDIIDEIVIGPCSQQNPVILKDFLRNNDFTKLAENVHTSESTLRL